jgi:glycerophosphoryl diester phosphodiesterase
MLFKGGNMDDWTQKMDVLIRLEKRLLQSIDFFYAKWPQPPSHKDRLKHCTIISHRGEHDNKDVFENTLSAFDQARDAGVGGIEFDIRWTKDLHPVVFHDTNLQRVFGSELELNKATLDELKAHCGLIPSLEEVIQKYGKKLHLMVEIKKEVYPDPSYQNMVLKDLFHGLSPQKDFHFISLQPEMFQTINFVPTSAFLPSARFNIKALSKLALNKNYGGIAGHYFILTNRILRKHHMNGQSIGTGYICSKNSLIRELNRGVKWIFSNNAVELQGILNSLLKY